MSIFKCKMCGGTIEFEQGATVGVCDSCGTKQTLPRLDDDKKTNLYDRANHFRRNNDFDKAMGIYEQILNEDNTDAESYWSLVLCRYGIEYVEDPVTHKRVPTVNRAQYTSIFADEDYKSALQYADGYQKAIYEEEAKAIDEIQKGILEISSKEEPFDVFICYKETDANGRRTPDSVLATELYHELTKEGFKVFFSRITLEDKLGTAYEPYIFAALNSAKVMVVLGTKPEYFNAVWVKNEWSRYLALIKNGAKKMLIPAYRDMDPYDLPEEFSHLQAQDMSKLGFMQDLIRGIKKIIAADAPKTTVKETVVVGANNAAVEPLLERVFLFLEDGKWQDANIYCEKVLDIDPKNAGAYLGKLMAELQVKNRKALADCDEPFDNLDNFSKVIRFGDEKLEAEMRGYIAHINDRNENARLTGIYNNAVSTMQRANTEEAYKSAANLFKSVSGFKDADSLVEECIEKAEESRKDAIYASAMTKMTGEVIDYYEEAIRILQTISGWRDADEQIYLCQRRIEELKANEETRRLKREREAEEARIAAENAKKKRKKLLSIVIPVACACIALAVLLVTTIIPNSKYNKAVALIDKGEVVSAYEELIAMNGYKDSADKASDIYDQYVSEKLKVSDIGDTVFFGSYEQDNNASNGKETVEWLILAKEDGQVLLISKYGLDCQKYNTSVTDITWEKCSLRDWLNKTFLNNTFSADEQARIAVTSVSAEKTKNYSMSTGKVSNDKVFLLSITEAEKYFASDSARQCFATAYAETQGDGGACAGNGACRWWLQSPGDALSYAASVDANGSIYDRGFGVDYSIAIRPAMWIEIEP